MIDPFEPPEPDAELTESLLRWAESRKATDEQLARLQARVVSAIAHEQSASLRPATTAVPRKSGLWGALALTLALLAAFALSLPKIAIDDPLDDHHVSDKPPLASALELVAFDKQLVQQKGALAAEMDAMFSGKWCWVAESQGDVRLEIGDRASHSPGAVAVRITVAQRRRGDAAWRPVWSVDCLAQGEEVVRLYPATDEVTGTVDIWTYALADELIAVDSAIMLRESKSPGREKIEAAFSGVQTELVPQQITALGAGDTEYQVQQTVAKIGEASL